MRILGERYQRGRRLAGTTNVKKIPRTVKNRIFYGSYWCKKFRFVLTVQEVTADWKTSVLHVPPCAQINIATHA